MIIRTIGLAALTVASSLAQDTGSQVLDKLLAFEHQLHTQLQNGNGVIGTEIRSAMDEVLAAIDIPRLSAEEVVAVAGNPFLLRFGGIREPLVERLHGVRKCDDAVGAQAACTLLLIARQDWSPPARDRMRDGASADIASEFDALVTDVKAVLAHPGWVAAMRQGRTKDFFAAMAGRLIPPVRKRILSDLLALECYLDEVASPTVLHGMTGMVRTTLQINDLPRSEDLRRFRFRLAVMIGALDLDAMSDPKLRDDLRKDLKWLRAGVATAQDLEGAMAPELDFAWSHGLGVQRLSELRGKIVVLDFWAWWCRPCLAAFPELADLAREYEGRVVFLGVTSAQGRMVTEDGVVDTRGDPEREHGLLAKFLKQRGVTWPIAVTDQPVINLDYGVLGLPTVVVVDKDGVVRTTGLDLKDKAGVRRVLNSMLR